MSKNVPPNEERLGDLKGARATTIKCGLCFSLAVQEPQRMRFSRDAFKGGD